MTKQQECSRAQAWQTQPLELDPTLLSHLASCEYCQARVAEQAALSARVRALPTLGLDGQALERSKARLLASATARPASAPARSWQAGAAAALLLIGSGGAWWWREQLPRGVPGASADRTTQVTSAPVEPTASKAISAPAAPSSLAGPVLAPLPANSPTSRPAEDTIRPARAPQRARARADLAERVDALDAEELFRQGLRTLASSQPALAAHWFARVPVASPLAEDAAYWRGVALARAQRFADAARVLTHFVDAYPGSPRRDEASVVLGWVFLEQRQQRLASSYFTEGLLAEDPLTRARAARGMATLRGGVMPAEPRFQ